jgi:hypothetical protein
LCYSYKLCGLTFKLITNRIIYNLYIYFLFLPKVEYASPTNSDVETGLGVFSVRGNVMENKIAKMEATRSSVVKFKVYVLMHISDISCLTFIFLL